MNETAFRVSKSAFVTSDGFDYSNRPVGGYVSLQGYILCPVLLYILCPRKQLFKQYLFSICVECLAALSSEPQNYYFNQNMSVWWWWW